MGKTPKKAAPGGDERNLYVRRLKATTASTKPSETSLPERQRESDGTKRSKPTGIQRKIPPDALKTFKSNLLSPAKLGLKHPPKRLGRPPGSTNKKKHLVPVNPLESKSHSMQPESEETEVKPEAVNKTEENKEENIKKASNESTDAPVEKDEVKNGVEGSPVEEKDASAESPKEQTSEEVQEAGSETKETSTQEGELSKQTSESEENEGNGIKLSLEEEEGQESTPEKDSKEDAATEESQKDSTNGATEKGQKEDRKEEQNDSQTDTETYSVDIVESTTSEVSDTSESASQQEQKEKPEQKSANEVSFVTYDSNIMLKDVQIKLNDCLKDNSKLFDASNTSEISSPYKDMSFGKTLRSISGRHSLSRMRHVTVREHRLSPNSSMFVNTSSASINPEETLDSKVLRYRSGVDDALSTNGSPAPERKRKLDAEGGWYSAKKQKTESENNSLLNTSIGLLRGLRRPVQVSTPNVAPQKKFSSSDLDVSGLTDDGQDTDGSRKWCVVM